MALADTLAVVEINFLLFRNCKYVLLDLWKATGLSWEEIADKILQSLEMKTVDLYLHYQDLGLLHLQSPGLFLIDFYFSIMDMFETVGHFKPQEKIILRCIKMLKGNEASGFLKNSRVINLVELRLASLYTKYGNIEESFRLHREILEKTKKLCEEKKSDSECNTHITDLFAVYNGLGITCIQDEDYDKAEEYFLQCMEIENRWKDISLNIKSKAIYLNIGNVYLFKGEHEKALKYFLKYLKFEEEWNYGHLSLEVGLAMASIGLCYKELEQLDKAEKYCYRSLEIMQKSVGRENYFCGKPLSYLSVLEQQRGNTDKAIEYIDEALRIFKLAEVLEYSREYLEAKQNKIVFLLNKQQCEKAIKEFLPFFATVVKYDKFKNTLTSLHTEIVKFMIRTNQMLDEAVYVTLSLIKGGVGSPVNYIHLDMLDIMMSEKDKRPQRSEEFSLEYAHKLWPEDVLIILRLIQFHLIPSCDTQGVIDMIADFDRVSNLGVQTYNFINLWLSEQEKIDDEILIGVNEAAMSRYPGTPYNKNFMRNIANALLRLGQRDKALTYFLKILAEEPDDAGTTLVIAQLAFLTNDIEMGKKYCHIAMEKFVGQDAAAKAKMLLEMVEKA